MKTLIESDAAVGIDLRTARDPDAQVSKLLRRFKAVPELLPRLSEGAMQLGDGRGCTRLATAMFGPRPQRRLRPATITDETVYYNWANEHEVRQQSFSKGLITWSEHQCWFRKRLQSPKALLLVLADINGLPLGQIRFERAENHTSRAVIGLSIDPILRGHGLAAELLQLGLAELVREWGSEIEAYAEVRSSNTASIRAFKRAKFVEGTSPRPEVRCFRRSAITML